MNTSYVSMSLEDEDALFETFEGVIWKVLKQLGFSPCDEMYDDLMQIGREELVRSYQNFIGNVYEEPTRFKFVSYLRKRVEWRVMDGIRKIRQWKLREQCVEEMEVYMATTDSGFDQWSADEIFYRFLSTLTEQEQKIGYCLVKFSLKKCEIARELNMSEKSMYRTCDKIKKKFRIFLEKEYM